MVQSWQQCDLCGKSLVAALPALSLSLFDSTQIQSILFQRKCRSGDSFAGSLAAPSGSWLSIILPWLYHPVPTAVGVLGLLFSILHSLCFFGQIKHKNLLQNGLAFYLVSFLHPISGRLAEIDRCESR